jgi:tetratricopeptide (TPR) repeat protein
VKFSNRFTRAFAAAGLTAALVTSAASTSLAGEEDARTLFAEGRKLREAGNCEAAVVVFRRALEVYPEGIGSLRNIAECEEELGKYAAARRSYWSLRTAAMQTSEPKYAGWDTYANEAHARLAPKVARLTVKLTGEKLERVQLQIDGKPLDPRLVGVELEREIGVHAVEAHYGGAAPVIEKVTLVGGAQETITLAIPVPAETPVKGGDTPPRKGNGDIVKPPPEGSNTLRTAGFVVTGIGALSAIGMGIAIGVRGGALSEIEDACPDYETAACPAEVAGARDRGETSTTLANVLGGVAIAGVAVGITMIVVGSSQDEPQRAAWLQVIPTAGGAGARAGVRF